VRVLAGGLDAWAAAHAVEPMRTVAPLAAAHSA